MFAYTEYQMLMCIAAHTAWIDQPRTQACSRTPNGPGTSFRVTVAQGAEHVSLLEADEFRSIDLEPMSNVKKVPGFVTEQSRDGESQMPCDNE